MAEGRSPRAAGRRSRRSTEPKTRILGLPDRWFWAIGYAAFCVMVEWFLNLGGFAYDVWGDTVNTAARMESHGVAGRVQVTAAVKALLGGAFHLEPRGPIDVKGLR